MKDFEGIIKGVVVTAIIIVILSLMYKGYKIDKSEKATKQKIEQMAKDRSNYVLKDLSWFEHEAKGKMGFDKEKPVFVKIPMFVDSYHSGTFYVADDKCKNNIPLHFDDWSYKDKVEDFYYANKAFYGYCKVSSGMLYIEMVDLK